MSKKSNPDEKRQIVFSRRPALKMSAKPAAAADDEPQVTLEGYALRWNELSTDRGGYVVRLKPGSAVFTNPVLAYYEHDVRALIGNTANNSLRIFPDDVGVRVEIDLPDTTTGEDVAELVEDEYLSGMSFSMADGFEESYVTTEDGQTIRNATKFTVDEVTVCVSPAFKGASVTLQDPAAEDDAELKSGQQMSDKGKDKPGGTPPDRLFQSARQQLNRLHLYEL